MTDFLQPDVRPSTERWLESSGMRRRIGVRLTVEARREQPNIVEAETIRRSNDAAADK